MPIFQLNQLVRDKLKDEYKDAGKKATYRKLSSNDLKFALLHKIIEEASEVDFNTSTENILYEIADIRQVFDDLIKLCGINEKQVIAAKKAKFAQKGGFSGGTFVETIELKDDDRWVDYYRQRPDAFPEK